MQFLLTECCSFQYEESFQYSNIYVITVSNVDRIYSST